MNYKDWEIIYKKISKDLKISYEDDLRSSYLLNDLLTEKEKKDIGLLEKKIKGKNVYIFGAGPSLEEKIKKYKENFIEKTIIASDGATSALIKSKIIPDIIVTDLDGKISDQIYANEKGSIIVIHSHGDNIKEIKNYFPKFKNNVFGTTQINPKSFKNLYNFAGFTDGDRAVYLASFFKAKKIFLIGFDFNGVIGKYSFAEKKDENIKLKKLKWCEKLIKNLEKEKKNIQEI